MELLPAQLFLVFQEGVLNDAPKTHLAAISHVGPDLRQALKNSIVDTFPNVSVIDVTQTAATILGVTDRLSLFVRFMAWFPFFPLPGTRPGRTGIRLICSRFWVWTFLLSRPLPWWNSVLSVLQQVSQPWH
ncbi:MAG: hypothetical protein GY860_11370 [Desulfobacteraceae bacterium]|nr:hypothetical protein [Desulfobacteraceae bacterium]